MILINGLQVFSKSLNFDEVREEIQDFDANEPVHQPLNRDEVDAQQRPSRQRKLTKRWLESIEQENLALSAVI